MATRFIRISGGAVILFLAVTLASCSRSTGSSRNQAGQITDVNASQASGNGRYPIQSCIIEYTLEIEGVKEGSQTKVFDQWGMREFGTRTMKEEAPVKTLVILDEDWIPNVDLLGKTGTRIKARYTTSSSGIEAILRTGEKVETEVVAGKECEKWRLDNDVMLWVWKSIPLKTQCKKDGKIMAQRALDVKENVSIPEEQFQIPPDVTLTEITQPREVLKALGYQ